MNKCTKCKKEKPIKKCHTKAQKQEKLIEDLSEVVHKAYCLYQKEIKGKEYWTKGDYSKLKDEDKEADRYTVRAVIKALKTYKT